MSHEHNEANSRRVLIALVMTAVFTVVELIGGIITGSLALLADAGHMLTDTMALTLAVIAFRVSNRPADSKRTYGYQRFQILAAFINGLCLLGIVVWIVVEAVSRLLSPQDIQATGMLYIACAGLVVNILSFAVLHGGDRENLNMRGAALHVLGDLLGSVAAIAAALVIIATGWTPIDPILSVLVAILILRSAWHLVRRSAHVLLEGSPDWLDVREMQDNVTQRVDAVVAIHHVHVWGLTQQDLMLTMHVVLDQPGTNATAVVREVKQILRSHYGIRHSTIEVDLDGCADDGAGVPR
ncbi:MAG: cation diffusion facilitator family transporter [Woeseia sp.]